MINVELYFNGEKAYFDAEETEAIAGTYAINKLGEVQSRQGYYTNTYNLPLSNENKRIFENAELPQNLSNLPYTLMDHLVLVEGVEVFRGVAKIESSSEYYEVTGFAGNSDFFSRIKDKSIRDLDLSEWDHVRDDVTILASLNEPDGYIYGYIDYGKYTEVVNPFVDISDLYPSVYFHTIIERIVSEAGYTMQGSVLNNARYREMVIPWNGSSADRDLSGFIFTGHLDLLNLPANENYVMAILTEDSDPRTVYDTFGFYECENNQEVTINITHTFVTDRGARFKLIKRPYTNVSNAPDSQAGDVTLAFGAGSDGVVGTFKIKTSCVEGDRIFLAYSNLGTFAGVAVQVNSASFQVTKLNDTFGVDWIVADNLPNIGQDKMFLEFLVQFCLIPFTDVETSTIRLVYFDDIKKNPPVDWSAKIDDKERPEVKYRFDEYGQNNILKYKNDEPDPMNSNVGLTNDFQKVFTINDLALELEVEVFESQFYLPDIGSSLGGQATTIQPKIYQKVNAGEEGEIIFKGIYDSTADYELNDAVSFEGKLYKANDAIGSGGSDPDAGGDWERIDDGDIWNITAKDIIGRIQRGGPTIAIKLTSGSVFQINEFIGYVGMTWPEIYAAHYNLFNEVITKTKIVKHLLRLNYADINQLDLTRPVYVQRYGCYFYCDIVEQFKFSESDSTYVTLIRI